MSVIGGGMKKEMEARLKQNLERVDHLVALYKERSGSGPGRSPSRTSTC